MLDQFAPLALLAALVVLAACSSPEEMEQALHVDAKDHAHGSDHVQASCGATAISGKGAAREVKVANEQYVFEYSYPQAAGSLAGLRAYLDNDLGTSQTEIAALAKEAMGDASEYDYPYRPYSLIVGWQVVTDLPGWISLSRANWTYTGGAHGNSDTAGLVWDKTAAAPFSPIELFTSAGKLEAALTQDYCTALGKLRAERRPERRPEHRPEHRPDAVDAGFADCPKLEALTLLVGSSDKQTFNRIGLIADPYVAGSFAEGPYEVTLPVNNAILAAVKPEYRGAFSIPR